MIISDVLLGLSWSKLLLHLLNFTILFVCLWLILYKPVKKAVQDRQDRIAKEKEETEANLRASEEAKAESERRLGEIDTEIAEKKKASDEEAAKAYEDMVAKANERAAEIIRDAEKEAAAKANRAIEGAKEELRDMAVSLAENIIASKIDDVDDKMIDDALKDWKND